MTIGHDEKEVGQELRRAQEPLRGELERLAAPVARDKGVEIAPVPKAWRKGCARRRRAPRIGAWPRGLTCTADRRKPLRGSFLGSGARVVLQLAYRAAAAKYAEAATLVAPFDAELQRRFLFAQADELFQQEDEFGDNAALIEAVAIYRRCLTLVSRPERPLDWASTRADLGRALKMLGERESGTARLEEAVSTYREALQELKRDRVPLLWAATKMNRGNALQTLGEREGGTARLEEAVEVFSEAMQETSRERMPLLWAAT